MCGGAGGGGAAPQSRAAPLPAAINSRPAQHVPAAAAAAAPRDPPRPPARSAVRGLWEPRGLRAGRGPGLWGGQGSSGRRAGAARHLRPRGYRGRETSLASCLSALSLFSSRLLCLGLDAFLLPPEAALAGCDPSLLPL